MPLRMTFHARAPQVRRPSGQVAKAQKHPQGSFSQPPAPSFGRERPQESSGRPDPKGLLSVNGGTLSVHAGTNHCLDLRLALDNGEDPNVRDADGDRLPLHWAAARGHVECVLLLLTKGADPLAVDGAGRTPAHLAFDLKQMDAVRILDGWAEARNLPDPTRIVRLSTPEGGAEPPPRATGGPTPNSSPFSTPPSDRRKKR